ncbi:TDP-N-acetylfucosamine:lipid II N-acetylfucosaminyltransferase [Clostridium sp. P21]|uniref:TDP-N-acetylfucosamine:lipid II N-acetylfucosaminyltransferase n=1 Tax=Clostridium muellerianum TaxID=2716538 RepID=A0A7Y0HL27_9CLOT|nr:TDP-N-acetylfucosamine:lipid II N-acetylfucosaminyltransferase [Clostridium muellerianum]NMM61484.1 TDP-N-acetylfucosamine:lipid II N-acetylfucosaminyltransferase [Clostridium muellerianum]
MNDSMKNDILKISKELLENVKRFIENNNIQEAVKFMKNYEEKNPTDYRIPFIKVLLKMEVSNDNLGQYKDLILQGLEKSPLNFDYNYNQSLAQVALDNNEYLKALEIYEKVLAEVENLEVKNEIREKIINLENQFSSNIYHEFQGRNSEINEICNMKKNYKNLHLMIDSGYSKKFIEFMNKHFQCKKNLFLILDYKDNLEYMDANIASNVIYIKLKKGWEKCLDVNTQEILFFINNSEEIYIHQLSDFITWLICKYDIKAKMNWIVWGSDLYHNIDIKLYDKLTEKFLIEDCNLKMKDYKNTNEYIYRKSTIRRLNKIIPDGTKGDYIIAKKFFLTKASYEYFIYPNPVDFISLDNNYKIKNEFNLKKKYKYVIQLGNSGDPSNNHLEIVEILSKMNESNFCVVCPLSYGNFSYINKVIPKIKKILGDRFIPLTTFLNSEDYFSILNQVDVAIMNHNRQQAISNILPLLYLGKKVYMKNNITTYATFKKLGFTLFNVNEIDFKDFQDFILMNPEDKIRNKNIVLDNYNEDVLFQNIKKFIKI